MNDDTELASPPRELRLLEEAVDERAARRGDRTVQRLFEVYSWSQMLAWADENWVDRVIEEVAFTSRALAELLALPEAEQARWIEERSWAENGLALADRLLEEAAERPLGDRLGLARLAARIVLRTPVPVADRLFTARAVDVLDRAGLLEVRALRRRGQLDEARSRFVELEQERAADPAADRLFFLTLDAERSLTGGLLARDEGRLPAARVAFSKAGRIFRLAASEEDDFELLHAQARTDLLRGDASRAVDRLTRAPAFQDRGRRVATGFLRLHAALRTTSPLVARHAALGLLVELGSARPRRELDHFRVAEAAVRLAEGQATGALEAVAGPAESLRAAGSLVGSLSAALVACRAELARKRPRPARAALAAGVLERFTDLPDIPAVRAVLAAVSEHARGRLDGRFLDRLDLWLVLAEDSPGVGLPDPREPRSNRGPRRAAPTS